MKCNGLFLFFALLMMLTGCGRSAPTTYYMLESGAPVEGFDKMPASSLRVAQVETPPYLNRNNIVSRVKDAPSLVLAEFHLWSEPVGAGMRRVIEETLLAPLYQDGIALLPGTSEAKADYTLLVDVLRLDGNFDEKAVLQAWWTLLDRDDNTLGRGLYGAEELVPGSNYNVLIEAESQLVRNFGQYLAGRLPELVATRQRGMKR